MPRQYGPFTEVRAESGNQDFEPLLGKPLKYDEGFENDGKAWDYDDESEEGYDAFIKNYNTPGDTVKAIQALGLPPKVQGNLGCGCREAVLHGVGEVKNGMVEVDYMCDSGWHNFFVFQMRVQGKKPERDIKIDKFGNLTTEKGFIAQELEEL